MGKQGKTKKKNGGDDEAELVIVHSKSVMSAFADYAFFAGMAPESMGAQGACTEALVSAAAAPAASLTQQQLDDGTTKKKKAEKEKDKMAKPSDVRHLLS